MEPHPQTGMGANGILEPALVRLKISRVERRLNANLLLGKVAPSLEGDMAEKAIPVLSRAVCPLEGECPRDADEL